MPDLTTILDRVRKLPTTIRLGDIDSGVDDLLRELLRKIEGNGYPPTFLSYKAALQEFSAGYNLGMEMKPIPQNQTPLTIFGYDTGTTANAAREGEVARQENAKAQHIAQVSQQIRNILGMLGSELSLMIDAQKRPYEFLLEQVRANNRGQDHISNSLAAVLSEYMGWTHLILNDGLDETAIRQLERTDTFDSNIRLGILYLFTRGPGEALHKLTLASQQASDEKLLDSLHHLSSNPYPAQTMLKPGYDRIKIAAQFGKRELAGAR